MTFSRDGTSRQVMSGHVNDNTVIQPTINKRQVSRCTVLAVSAAMKP